jgi:hypothetical protein
LRFYTYVPITVFENTIVAVKQQRATGFHSLRKTVIVAQPFVFNTSVKQNTWNNETKLEQKLELERIEEIPCLTMLIGFMLPQGTRPPRPRGHAFHLKRICGDFVVRFDFERRQWFGWSTAKSKEVKGKVEKINKN